MRKLPAIEKILALMKQEEEGDCLVWIGSVTQNGHPQFSQHLVRRLLWSNYRGEIPDGLHIKVCCDTALCCNLEHMQLMTIGRIARLAAKAGAFSTPQRRAAITAGRRATAPKLTIEKAREIRSSTLNHEEEAARQGVNSSLIARIRRHEVWAEAVPGASIFTLGAAA